MYVIPREKIAQVRKLKGLLRGAKDLYLATDEDREGEAISWHLCEVLQPKVPVHRLVFHEITKEAILDALEQPREIDQDLVRAQEVRRIVDRLYGYDVSPLLWRKIRPRLSAGRVQSVAVRLIVEREQQRRAFVPATYWDLSATFAKTDGSELRGRRCCRVDGRKIPAGRDFDPSTGTLKDAELLLLDERQAAELAERSGRRRVPRERTGGQAVHDPPLSAFYHQHAAAGSQPEVRLHRPADDAGGAEPLRERAHHVHAHGLDQPGGRGGGDARGSWSPRSSARSTCRRSRAITRRR